MVKFILRVSPDSADIVDSSGLTPLWIAAQKGDLQILDLLLEHGARVEVCDTDSRRTAIHQAAQEGHLEVVRRLLERGACADPRSKDGISPLWSAAQGGHHHIVRLLIDHGADKETTSLDGERRPIHQVAQNGHAEAARVLLEAGAEANPERQSLNDKIPSPFWLAAQNGNVAVGTQLVGRGANVDYIVGSSMRRPIHQATQSGHTDFVRLLLEHRASVDAREEDGWTPLMMAAQNGHLEICDLLLRRGANVDAEEKDQATALWLASQQGHINIVKRLYEAGAKVIATKDSRRRPLHQATQNAHLEVVKFLVDMFKEDVNAMDKREATPFMLASQGEEEVRVEIMEFLHGRGANAIV